MAQYKFGTDDPTITPDVGAGAWNSEPTTIEMRAHKAGIIASMAVAYVVIGDDATRHMAHYLHNSGRDLTIDLQGLLDDVPNEKALYESELSEAKRFVQGLSEGTFQITSAKASGGYILQKENKNWFFAIGGYSAWGKGTAVVSKNPSGQRVYSLSFEYKFFDRYNWDGKKSVNFHGIVVTDEFMGRFHREGLAQEFNMYGSVTHQVNWGAAAPSVPPVSGVGGRGRS